MATIYEGMFLLDNQVVRADWARAKAVITDALQKHGANVLTARRWDERKLAYTIRGRRRATFLLTFFEHAGDGVNGMRRDLDLDERVLRYLMLGVEALPEGELEKSQAELAEGFTVPSPPPDEETVSDEEVVEDAPAPEEMAPEGMDAEVANLEGN